MAIELNLLQLATFSMLTGFVSGWYIHASPIKDKFACLFLGTVTGAVSFAAFVLAYTLRQAQ